jgi:hypothetical protein
MQELVDPRFCSDRGGRMNFCEPCAIVTRKLVFDSAAKSSVELMSGSIIWSDERSLKWCTPCVWAMRKWFHLRYKLVVGDQVSPAETVQWQAMKQEYPDWPLFRLERCTSQDAEIVRRMVSRASRKFCVDMERLDREYRNRTAKNQENADSKPN